MSKENREISIEEKFQESNTFKVKLVGEHLVHFYYFKKGYLLAQKEMQEKLDAAVEVTKFLSERLIHVYNESENLDYHIKARDLLKARME